MTATPTTQVVISPMRRRHLRGVSRIEDQVNHRPWSSSLFAGELRLPESRNYLVALEGATVLGFGGVMYTGFEAHLTNIAVDPEARRRQIATRLMLVLMADSRARGVEDMTLEVRITNEGAQELYRAFGFAPGGIRRNYYADIGEDALIMWAHDLQGPEHAARLDGIGVALGEPLVTGGFPAEAAR
jgi:ribosomal-protein-alanine N-acetyltransferase